MKLIISLIIICIACLIAGLMTGYYISKVRLSKKLVENYYAGDLVIDMEKIDGDTISIDFTMNPKEIMAYNFVLIGVKVRQ